MAHLWLVERVDTAYCEETESAVLNFPTKDDVVAYIDAESYFYGGYVLNGMRSSNSDIRCIGVSNDNLELGLIIENNVGG